MKNEKIINNKVKTEISAGCVVYRKLKAEGCQLKAKFALGKHSGYHKWVLPKGLIEEGEDKVSTAVRETKEELGIKVKVINPQPIYVAQYIYFADLKDLTPGVGTSLTPGVIKTRRVSKYAEHGGGKTKVFKTVYFYPAEYVSGNIAKHGWEMSEAGWFDYETTQKIMDFTDEKKAVQASLKLLQ